MTVLVIDCVIKDKEDTLKLQRDIDRFDLIPKKTRCRNQHGRMIACLSSLVRTRAFLPATTPCEGLSFWRFTSKLQVFKFRFRLCMIIKTT